MTPAWVSKMAAKHPNHPVVKRMNGLMGGKKPAVAAPIRPLGR